MHTNPHMLRLCVSLALSAAMLTANTEPASASTKALPTRSEIPEAFRWQLGDIYSSEQAWEHDVKQIAALCQDISQYKGRLGQSADTLLAALQVKDTLTQLLDKVYVYAHLRRDENTANTTAQALSDRATQLYAKVLTATSYFEPEILAIPTETIEQFVKERPALTLYNFYLTELARQKPHVLSTREEEILARASEVLHAPKNIYTIARNTDLKYVTVKDEQGQEIELSEGRYHRLLLSPNREVRKAASEGMHKTYGSLKHTFASTFSANVKKNLFYAGLRNYPSALGASLEGDNIPVEVYTNLIDAVSTKLPVYHRYLALRKKLLGVNELHQYDLYAPLLPDIKWDVDYTTAKKMVKQALRPLGKDYGKVLDHGMNSGWIDVYESKNKQTGAYAWGTYGVHPYVLLNYHDTIDDAFTLAHEMGHALHSYYSDKHQPYLYAGYTIFSAEVASTTNEALFIRHLLSTTSDVPRRLFLLNHYLEQFQGTLFRQAQFAEFELLVHRKAEQGEALTVDVLNKIWHDLNVKYLGPDVVIDEYTDIGWARIPHFYNSFYVYKYVTGFSAGTTLAEQMLTEGDSARDHYLGFLKSGGSDYTLNLLKKAGVDMSTPKPIDNAISVFERTLNEFEDTTYKYFTLQ